MASKFLRGHRMKPKDQKKTDDDDVLAIEKAAAWAWYQRGSGSEGKGMIRESHIMARTPQRDHRPSRYKLEAMRMSSSFSSSSSQETKEEEGLSNKSLPLLDEYEVRSILTRLGSLIAESSSDDKLDNGFGSANGDQRTMMMKKKKVGRKGMWERRRVRVICSTRKEDVVEYVRRRRDCKESHHQIHLSAPKCSMPSANNGGSRRVM